MLTHTVPPFALPATDAYSRQVVEQDQEIVPIGPLEAVNPVPERSKVSRLNRLERRRRGFYFPKAVLEAHGL